MLWLLSKSTLDDPTCIYLEDKSLMLFYRAWSGVEVPKYHIIEIMFCVPQTKWLYEEKELSPGAEFSSLNLLAESVIICWSLMFLR